MSYTITYRAVDYQTDVIQHHGILGQKWGIRRYQNEDGSLTDEGKRRYLKKDGSIDVDKLTKRYQKDLNKLERRRGIHESERKYEFDSFNYPIDNIDRAINKTKLAKMMHEHNLEYHTTRLDKAKKSLNSDIEYLKKLGYDIDSVLEPFRYAMAEGDGTRYMTSVKNNYTLKLGNKQDKKPSQNNKTVNVDKKLIGDLSKKAYKYVGQVNRDAGKRYTDEDIEFIITNNTKLLPDDAGYKELFWAIDKNLVKNGYKWID